VHPSFGCARTSDGVVYVCLCAHKPLSTCSSSQSIKDVWNGTLSLHAAALKFICKGHALHIHFVMTLLIGSHPWMKPDAAISNSAINACGNSAHVGNGCRQQRCIKIEIKPLQTEKCILSTAYWNSSSPYLTVPSPTPYDVAFSHNTCVTDRRQTDRQTNDITYTTGGQKLPAEAIKRGLLASVSGHFKRVYEILRDQSFQNSKVHRMHVRS